VAALVAAGLTLWRLRDSMTATGVPVVREVHLAGHHVPVLITPGRPGANLVLVDGPTGGVSVGSVEAQPRAGASGLWAVVELPAGASTVWIEFDGRRASVDVDTGPGEPGPAGASGVDGPECASAALAAALAQPGRVLTSCPADSLSGPDEASLRSLVEFLAGRGVRSIAVEADGSARSGSAAAVVREAAEASGVPVGAGGALVVVSGWAAADGMLAAVAKRQASQVSYPDGTYLAPWLLNAPVVDATAGAVIALRFDPRDDDAVRYQLALAGPFHDQRPTSSGYQAWRTANGGGEPPRTRLYAVSRVSVMPRELGMHQHGHDGGWFPGGTVVPVSGTLGSAIVRAPCVDCRQERGRR
jgi:hypothetical protein